jgi:hypothetical protein
MNRRTLLASLVFAAAAGLLGYWLYQDSLVPVALVSDEALFVPAKPEFGEDEVVLEAQMPAGPNLEAFLDAQSSLALLEPTAEGWAGQLLTELQGARHGRRWRLVLKPGWRLQEGGTLEAVHVAKALAPHLAARGGEARRKDALTLELRFKARQDDVPALLAQWRIPGTGPFRRQGGALLRFEGFHRGRTGVAGLRVATDPSLMESRAWAEGLASARWAWAVFPGHIAPEDMAKVRIAPYDEFRMKDGSVWFLSRRLRRLRPNTQDWTRTRLFGAWKGAMDLPYDPLGM